MLKFEMRDAFFEPLVDLALMDENIIFLTADHGAFSLDRLKEKAPDRFINVGISEQNMISVAAGLALEGKKVFAYGITPFVSLKVLEQLSLDVATLELNVNIVSVGVGFTYSTDGPSHHGLQDLSCVMGVPNLQVLNSSDPSNTAIFAQMAVNTDGPKYIRIEKGMLPVLERVGNDKLTSGFSTVSTGEDMSIVATGAIVHDAVAAAKILKKELNLSVRVIDLYQLRPFPTNNLVLALENETKVVTIEEGFLSGGMGSAFGTMMLENGLKPDLMRIGVNDRFCYEYGDRDFLKSKFDLNAEAIAKKIMRWLD